MISAALKNLPQMSYAGKEAINTLCMNLTFSGEHIQKILLTSCHASEGKTFLALNIVRTLAKLDKKAVLVDCDLRRSSIARKYLDHREGPVKGLAHYLSGLASMDNVLYQVANVPNMAIVPCGRHVSNPLPLISSSKLQELLDGLAERMEYVIVDAPPVGVLIDAAKIATSCDGTLLVVNYNAVRKQELIHAQEQLEQSGCPILGTVINRADFGNYLSRKQYYSQYYDRQ